MAKNIVRSALGRSGNLGSIYDFRTDTFQGDNVFKEKLDIDDIYPTELGNTTVELLLSDSYEDKFHHLDIEAELSVSILCGLVKVSGSGKYLEEKRKSAKTSSMSLIYNVTTTTEEVYIRQLKNKVDFDAVNSTDATHVLTSVDWGAVCTITALYEFSDNDEKKIIEGALHAELNKLKGALDVSGDAKVDFKDTMKGHNEKFRFISKCDVGSRSQDLPVTFEEAVSQAKALPSLVEATNGRKGVPLKFTFTPLSTIQKWFRQENAVNVIYQSIKEESLKRVVRVAQMMTDTFQRLTDLQNDFKKGIDCITDDDFTAVNDLVAEFGSEEAKFKDNLQILLKGIRSCEKDISELDTLSSELLDSKFSPTKMDGQIAKWEVVLNKIAFVQKTVGAGVRYFGRHGNVDFNEKDEMYILYTEDIPSQSEALSFFWKLQKTKSKQMSVILFCIVDLAIHLPVRTQKDNLKNKIAHYKGGKKVSVNVMDEYERDIDSCLIQFSCGKLCPSIPHNRAPTVLRCPAIFSGEANCSGDAKEWICYRCKGIIWYGIKTKMFYCQKCKMQCSPKESLFRCDEDSHGLDFLEYPKDYLFDDLAQLRESKKLNILILGETGVGKSTWINAFANYLYFDSLEDAIEASKQARIVVIPSKFTYTEDGETKDISIGAPDDNEQHVIGVSNTQETRTYPFQIGEYTVNFIDTPGIGDTRGSQQDDKNMENILHHISYYEEIHAIVILLKPNNARLGIFFKHCIQQLLTHLHRDAVNNITFIFTNTRATFYQPGETLPALRKLLREKKMGIEAVKQNIFCYDNEAFRFLACVLNGIVFDSSIQQIYETSWKKASEETKRLMDHIRTLKPHAVHDTTTLNRSRQIIVELSRPLQEFAKTVRTNINQIKYIQEQALALGSSADSFLAKLNFEGTTLDRQELSYPRTVCTHKDCVKLVPVGKDSITQPVYTQHCHPECNLGGSVTPEVIGDARLMGCAAMSSNKCKVCHHHYTVHMHRTYDLIQVKKTFISDEMQLKFNEKMSEKTKAELKKKELERVVNELQTEEKEIQKIGAQFAAFLKTFAIIPFNDSMGDYIDMQIKEEEEKSQVDRNMAQVEAWRNYKQAYEYQRQILEKALAETKDTHQGQANAASDIGELKTKLFSLKHFGSEMKNVFNKIDEGGKQLNTFQYGAVPTPPRAQKKNFIQRSRNWLGKVYSG